MSPGTLFRIFFVNGGYVAFVCLNGYLLYRTSAPFLEVRPKLWWKVLLFLTFGGSSRMVIWVGDPNLLYTLPCFLLLVMIPTQGDWVGRLAVTVIFFCITMSVCALLDTYSEVVLRGLYDYDIFCRVARTAVFGLLYLFMRRFLPQERVSLPRRLWKVVFGLSIMPLCAMIAVVLLTHSEVDSLLVHSMALNQGLAVLPFTLITSVILLFTILILADHEELEQTVHLAGLREIYYQGLQREQLQVRTLRHDLRNHVTAVRGLLEQGETEQAIGYLSQMTESSSLGGGQHFCDNEVADVVLSAKAKDMTQRGLQGLFQVSLPKTLLMADIDLCALLGNAIDNAMEAAEKSEDKEISVHCRVDKGLFMLRVENALAGDEKPDLSTTKADKTAHGFGLMGMREIAKRYGGSLEATAKNGRFELVVCLPL